MITNYDLLAEKTRKLLEQENVTIFEPAFLIDDLFIRVDILVKKGNNIKLIEVKAKSISSIDHQSFIKSNGKLGGGWDLYLYDIAFQKYVIQSCYPEWNISSYLKLADKDATTTVDGLHQCFKVVSGSDLRTGIEKKEGITKADLGDPILCEINVNEEIDLILNTNPLDENRSFEETVKHYKDHYKNDMKLFTEIGAHCKGCEFVIEDHENGSKSGFHECWQEQLQLPKEKIDRPKVYDVWYNPAKNAIEEGRYFMEELTENDINIRPEAGKMSRSERQWLQIEKQQNADDSPYFDIENLTEELAFLEVPIKFYRF